MPHTRKIETDADYEDVLGRIDDLMDAEPGTSEGNELDALMDLIETYEGHLMSAETTSPITDIQVHWD